MEEDGTSNGGEKRYEKRKKIKGGKQKQKKIGLRRDRT